jgi:putative endonuclease
MVEFEKHPAVYILANRYRGTIYTGVTSELWTRVANHKNGATPGFTSTYGVKTLVWYEHRLSMEIAIRREKKNQSLEARLED